MIKQPKELPEHVDPKAEKIDKSTVEGIYAKQARLRKEQDEAWFSFMMYYYVCHVLLWGGGASENWIKWYLKTNLPGKDPYWSWQETEET